MRRDQHPGACQCSVCQQVEEGVPREEALRRLHGWEARQLRKHGFYVHFIVEGLSNGMADIHTHGIRESFGHAEFQLTVNVGDRNALAIFHALVDRVRAGEVFRTGVDYKDIARGYKTRFIDATEGGRPVLRLVVPDVSGNLEKETMDLQFAKQYECLEDS